MVNVLERVPVSVSYTIETDVDTMMRILDKDKAMDAGQTLDALLHNLDAVEEVEYDGHFGPFLFIKVDKDSDCAKLWEDIQEIIDSYLGK